MHPSSSVAQLLDALIAHWRFWGQHEEFYIKTLAPSLVENPGKGDETERDLRNHRTFAWAKRTRCAFEGCGSKNFTSACQSAAVWVPRVVGA